MNTLGDRVAHVIQASNLPVKDVAKYCGVTVQAVYAWKRGEVKDLRNDPLFLLADLTGFSARWIATGAGSRSGIQDPNTKALVDFYENCDGRGKAAILRVAESESRYLVTIDADAKKSA